VRGLTLLARFLNPPNVAPSFQSLRHPRIAQGRASVTPADIAQRIIFRDRDSSHEWILWQVANVARELSSRICSAAGNVAGCATGYARRHDLKNRAARSGPRINPAEIIRALGSAIPWFILAPAAYVSRMVVSRTSPTRWTIASSFQLRSVIHEGMREDLIYGRNGERCASVTRLLKTLQSLWTKETCWLSSWLSNALSRQCNRNRYARDDRLMIGRAFIHRSTRVTIAICVYHVYFCSLHAAERGAVRERGDGGLFMKIRHYYNPAVHEFRAESLLPQMELRDWKLDDELIWQ